MPETLTALVALVGEHQPCGELDGGLDNGCVWLACSRGTKIAHLAVPMIAAPARRHRRSQAVLGAVDSDALCRAHFRLYRPTSSTLTTIRPWMAFRKSALVFRGGRETSVSRA